MQNKCCFIIPYFGKLPSYFPVFLKSCSWNKEFTWLLFTDDTTKYRYPNNVIPVYIEYAEFRNFVQSRFEFIVALDSPYKLCDLKPAYGYIFEEYIKQYDFWGHCDIDMIVGNLGKFLTDEILREYDKLFCLGHFILYRNTRENNRVFMTEYHGDALYKTVFSKPEICWFDEEWKDRNNINQIFIQEGKKVLQEDWSANFNIEKQSFERVIYRGQDLFAHTHGYEYEENIKALYVWDKGHVYRLRIQNNQLVKEEFMYMHFQQRNMRYHPVILEKESFKIVPNAFLRLDKVPCTIDSYKSVRRHTFCIYFLKRQVKKYKEKVQFKWTRVRQYMRER